MYDKKMVDTSRLKQLEKEHVYFKGSKGTAVSGGGVTRTGGGRVVSGGGSGAAQQAIAEELKPKFTVGGKKLSEYDLKEKYPQIPRDAKITSVSGGTISYQRTGEAVTRTTLTEEGQRLQAEQEAAKKGQQERRAYGLSPQASEAELSSAKYQAELVAKQSIPMSELITPISTEELEKERIKQMQERRLSQRFEEERLRKERGFPDVALTSKLPPPKADLKIIKPNIRPSEVQVKGLYQKERREYKESGKILTEYYTPPFQQTVSTKPKPSEKEFLEAKKITTEIEKTMFKDTFASRLESKAFEQEKPISKTGLLMAAYVIRKPVKVAADVASTVLIGGAIAKGSLFAVRIGLATKYPKFVSFTKKTVEYGLGTAYLGSKAVELYKEPSKTTQTLIETAVEAPAFYVGGKIAARLFYPTAYKTKTEFELATKYPKEYQEFESLRKGSINYGDIKPAELEFSAVKSLKKVPKFAETTEFLVGKYKADIAVSGSLAQRAYVKSISGKRPPKEILKKFIPKDIDLYSDVSLQKKFLEGYKEAGIKVKTFPSYRKIDVYRKLKPDEVGFYKGTFYTTEGKALEFHPIKAAEGKTTLAGTLRTVSPYPFYYQVTETPSGVTVPKLRYLTERALYGGFEQDLYRYSKDIPRFKAFQIIGKESQQQYKPPSLDIFKLKERIIKQKPIKEFQAEKGESPPSPKVAETTFKVKEYGEVYKPFGKFDVKPYPILKPAKETYKPFSVKEPTSFKYTPPMKEESYKITTIKPAPSKMPSGRVPVISEPKYKPIPQQPERTVPSITKPPQEPIYKPPYKPPKEPPYKPPYKEPPKEPPTITVPPPYIPRKKYEEQRPIPAFMVFEKRKGKFFEIGRGLPKGKALQLGAEKTKATLGATFKIVPFGMTKQKDIPFTPSIDTFRQYQIVKGQKIQTPFQFIQRKEKRLSARTEVAEIQESRKKKIRKKSRGLF